MNQRRRTAGSARSQVWVTGLVGAAVAGALNVAIFAIASAADVTFTVPGFGEGAEPTTVAGGQVLFMSIAPLVLGTAVAAFAVSRRKGLVLPQVVGGVLALLSLVVPLSLDADITETSTKSALAAMHVVAGVAYVASMQWARRAAVEGQVAVAAGVEGP